MIFESLGDKLQRTLKGLKGKGKLTETDINLAMREVKMALLEADVNFKVVKDFIAKVKERAIGVEVMESLTPGQQVVKIVNDELTALMGNVNSKIAFSSKPPTVVMMVGLQGAGKTTTVGKLAKMFKDQGKMPMAVACDVYRPAAIKQLEVVCEKAGVPVYKIEGSLEPIEISKQAVERAKVLGNDIVIIDTAGRLHIDEKLMGELQGIKSEVRPNEILLVLDAMTGQDAVTVADSFDKALGIDGVVLTKLDGDTRGGAALSIRAVTSKPIKFAAVGEKLEDLEPFHPDRMASRILGMGDVMSLIEKAQLTIDDDTAKSMEDKMRRSDFNFNDFLDQMQQIKKMGPIKNLLEMIPGMSKQIKDIDIDDNALVKVESIIYSMTKDERANPSIITPSRKRRIAKGCGKDVAEINRLIKQFEDMKKMMKQMNGSKSHTKKSGRKKSAKKGKFPFGGF